ncbi:PREDICTED: DNA mismatch repair protein MLH3 isoform X2 [Ipomoea nil]|uniref:DNA mismatch repair protein MLH3 isoform X2 n=1 Tax=Ipomoea nil TaxID=35883 RepID=UPI000901FF83|nr:PREDICTED: DNA mismatch repair protein MLH3 isoform X2 [Ipomoea nil]
MRSIAKLPEAVHSSIRSGVVLYDLTRVVEELVYNSLDAGANKVSVAVGVGTCYVTVVDNGYGVSRDGLELLGEKYATSKYDPLDDMNSVPLSFGYRGEALSSITAVSLVEIVTKAHGRPNGYRKVLKGHKCLYLGISDDRHDVGTTVTVRDLFYNQPVRRKHMLSNPKKVIHVVKECVLRIALLHPNVSFKVVDIESEEELLHTRPFPSSLPLLAKVFGIEASSSLEELNVAGDGFKLSGYISGTPDSFSWKAFQYVYINSRFICKGPIHKMLNNLAASFNIGSQSEKQSRPQICPAFILNLNCPKSCYDLTFEPSKTSVEFKDWDSVLTFIGDAVGCLWSGSKSADLSVKCEIGKKRRRALNSMGSQGTSPQSKKVTEECNNFHPSRENKSPSHCGVVISLECSSDLSPLPHNVFSHGDNDLLGLNRSNKQLNYTFSSGWKSESPKIDAGTNRLLKDHMKFNNSPELDDNSGVYEDVRKPFLQSCFLHRRLEPGETSLASDEGLEFKIEDHSKQNAFRANDRVVEEVNNINKIMSPRNVWDNEQTDVLRFSKTTIQHDVQHRLNLLLGDSVNSSLNPELSYEEGLFLPDFVKPFQRSTSCLHSDSCISSPVPSNYLTGIPFKNIAHTISEDLVANSPEYNGKEECFFSSSKTLSSDVKDCAGFKENSSDFQEHDLYDPFFPMEISTDFQDHNLKDAFSPNSFNIFTDCINTWGEDGITNCSTSRHHASSIGFDCDSCTRVHPRNLSKMFDPYRRGRRSNSAPPFYRGRKKFLALSDSLTMTTGKVNLQTIHHCPGFPGSNNMKQIQHPSEVNGVNSSFSDDIPDVRILKSDKGKCNNKCSMDSFEEFIPKEIQDPLDSGEKWQNSHPHLTSGSRLLHPKNQDAILDIASGILHLAGDSLIPRSLDKNCLENAKVLQQVDKKFIPIVATRTLALIDQHAADERIRLEELRRKVLSGELRRTNYLDSEQELVMPEIGFQLLHDYAEQIQNWGWICNVHSQGSRSFTRDLNIMHKQQAIATLLAVPCILGVNLSDVDLLEFLQQLADTDGSSTVPPSVHRVLNNKACRGAIMFGDALLPSECSLIVEELKQTSLCFQCAHGRPTTVPLVNLDALSEQIAKITSWSSSSCESWHGLRRHEISLQRTAQRLSSATH